MKYDRCIEASSGLVFFNENDSVVMDCSALAADGLAFVIDAGGQMWVEKIEFDGRHYDYDFTTARQMFIDAEALFEEQNPVMPEDTTPTITALQGLLALDQSGLSADYTQWATDPARTFAEKAYIDKATMWRRDAPVLNSAAQSMGLTSEQVDALFVLAATL
jgi:hypothetical protein